MDQLTSKLEQTRIQEGNTQPTGNDRVLDEATRANSLIRDLYVYAENKTQGTTSKRRRNLVHANEFELDLQKERGALPSTTTSSTGGPHGTKMLTVTSWKMNEFEYVKGTLPTLARGLFTCQDLGKGRMVSQAHHSSETHINGIYRILIRGYDKFFNVGEVTKTQPEWIAENTEGPYEVTLKENGCIIFMAGLPPHLVGPQGGCVVSSKHVLALSDSKGGSAQDNAQHASKGHEWLEKTLATKGKTLQEFGLWLWNQNLTAVAELCDDSFEEHVLQYPAEKSGLYLHGLNRNTASFQTLPSEKVQEAAKQWGFWPTDYVTFNSNREVMDFAEKVRNAGEYDNRAVEGFVVRCRTKQEGNIHFFKIKYDEPYLMYREWREITKHLWSLQVKRLAAETKKVRMKYPLTKAYVEFVKDLMHKQPALFADYNKNLGIIAIRDMFLKEWESKSTQDQESSIALSLESNANAAAEEDFQRTVLIPIATIGCGKTTVSVALAKLFGWAHVSSDDFNHMRKNPGQKFIKEIVDRLKKNMVVIADRNNFEYLHRERIMAAVHKEYPKTRFVALYWSHDDLPISRIREMEIERVKSRGSNHQTLTPEYCPEFETVIHKFLVSFQPLHPMVEPDSNFSYVVESKVGEDSLTFVERIVKEFAIPTLGAGGIGNHSIPKPEEIKEAVRYALEDWKPERVASGEAAKHFKGKQADQTSLVQSDQAASGSTDAVVTTAKSRRVKEPKYYAISLEVNAVLRFMDEDIAQADGSKDRALWTRLQEQIAAWKADNRIGIYQHVTLIHTSTRKDTSPKKAQRAEELWKFYVEELARAATSPTMSTASSPTISAPESPMAALSATLEKSLTLSSSAPSSSPTAASNDEFVEVKAGRRGKGHAAAQAANSSSARAVASASSTMTTSSPSASGDIESELQATVAVDFVIWTERIMVLRVSSAKRVKSGRPYETVQPTLHVTVGTVGDHVKPYESNEVLRQWNAQRKHGSPGSGDASGPEIFSVKLDKPKIFSGVLRGKMF
ncbi:RNA ligase-domain-containing protein [Dissophora ornata]|nr:RNA ligase-domain-containing protein [Dissophora ornata]